jgi:hypothetical protein
VTLPSLEWQDVDGLRVIVFGPGYGESIILGTRRSGWIVIDSLSADDDDGHSVNPALTLLDDVSTGWELLMLTHPHADHAGGMAQLVNQPGSGIVACVQRFQPVVRDWDQSPDMGEDPAVTVREGPKEMALKAITSAWARLPAARQWDPPATDVPIRLADVELRCLWPTDKAVDAFADDDDANTISTAMIVRWGGVQLLLGADVLAAQWKQIEDQVGPDVLKAHGLMKVPHHGSKGAIVEALGVCPGDRLWVVTPWNRGRGLPRFEEKQGVARLHQQYECLHLSSLPFRLPSPAQRPFRLTRDEAQTLREQSRSDGARAVARHLPLPVRDGWIDMLFTGDSVAWTQGDAAGMITPTAAD